MQLRAYSIYCPFSVCNPTASSKWVQLPGASIREPRFKPASRTLLIHQCCKLFESSSLYLASFFSYVGNSVVVEQVSTTNTLQVLWAIGLSYALVAFASSVQQKAENQLMYIFLTLRLTLLLALGVSFMLSIVWEIVGVGTTISDGTKANTAYWCGRIVLLVVLETLIIMYGSLEMAYVAVFLRDAILFLLIALLVLSIAIALFIVSVPSLAVLISREVLTVKHKAWEQKVAALPAIGSRRSTVSMQEQHAVAVTGLQDFEASPVGCFAAQAILETSPRAEDVHRFEVPNDSPVPSYRTPTVLEDMEEEKSNGNDNTGDQHA